MPRDPQKQSKAIERARDLRAATTFPERLLWSRLRRDALGVHFRRQHPIGPYFADFCCVESRLVIEIDGVTHNGILRHQQDATRTAFLNSLGLRVMRFTNDEVLKNLEGVVGTIRRSLTTGAQQRGALRGGASGEKGKGEDERVVGPSPVIRLRG